MQTRARTVFEPLQPPTTFEKTVERLGTAIRVGLLPPGTRLPSERELAAQLGIARSTLRQAITTLVQSGHLESVRGRGGGTFVVEAPPLAGERDGPLRADWREILDARVAVELGAAALAAERAAPADLDRMAEQVEVMAGAPPWDAYRRADIAFHLALAEAAHAPRLIAQMAEVQSDVSELIAHIAHPAAVLRHSNEEHRRLVVAVAQGDAGRAVRVLRGHLQGTEHILAGLAPG